MAGYGKRDRDQPWIMRTYAGHTTAAASNELYRTNLAKGQTGLSIAFDLPTQTGYDADDPLAHGEVGKVGVPISHVGDMRTLFEGLPLEQMNTSMTINATAVWLLSLYVAVAEEEGVDPSVLRGTTQNDIIKEYLSRGTHIFPPAASMRLTTDLITYTVNEVPKWNPINICSYHLQEAGATPTQELAYALVTAIGVLDAVKATNRVPESEFDKVVGRMSFFVNAGIRFIEEMCKMRAFARLWDRVTQERYGITDPTQRRFRYGIQVNSLGLTEQQPENNIIRIVLEMLAVTLSRDARARAIQLPAWNEALGLPRPWDQQWSLRAQQILAYETDLLEYADLFVGSKVVEAETEHLVESAWAEVQEVLRRGGAVEAVETGYIKQKLVESNAARLRAIESGEQIVVGVNKYLEGEPSPLTENLHEAILTVDPTVETKQREALARWKKARDARVVNKALSELERVAKTDENIMAASIAAAHAGVTTGEWANTLRQVWGEYRAPTGVVGATVKSSTGAAVETIKKLRGRLNELESRMGRRPKLLVGKPGLDGHSNGAEQIAIKARDVGFDVVYEGIRVSPQQIVASALEEGVHLVGLSILSGSHLALVPEVLRRLREAGLGDVPVVVGGIIPDADAKRLRHEGVAAVYTPKDFELDHIMSDLIDLVDRRHAAE
jgi:(2R)-ethylmalonyl-CoA mutase